MDAETKAAAAAARRGHVHDRLRHISSDLYPELAAEGGDVVMADAAALAAVVEALDEEDARAPSFGDSPMASVVASPVTALPNEELDEGGSAGDWEPYEPEYDSQLGSEDSDGDFSLSSLALEDLMKAVDDHRSRRARMRLKFMLPESDGAVGAEDVPFKAYKARRHNTSPTFRRRSVRTVQSLGAAKDELVRSAAAIACARGKSRPTPGTRVRGEREGGGGVGGGTRRKNSSHTGLDDVLDGVKSGTGDGETSPASRKQPRRAPKSRPIPFVTRERGGSTSRRKPPDGDTVVARGRAKPRTPRSGSREDGCDTNPAMSGRDSGTIAVDAQRGPRPKEGGHVERPPCPSLLPELAYLEKAPRAAAASGSVADGPASLPVERSGEEGGGWADADFSEGGNGSMPSASEEATAAAGDDDWWAGELWTCSDATSEYQHPQRAAAASSSYPSYPSAIPGELQLGLAAATAEERATATVAPVTSLETCGTSSSSRSPTTPGNEGGNTLYAEPFPGDLSRSSAGEIPTQYFDVSTEHQIQIETSSHLSELTNGAFQGLLLEDSSDNDIPSGPASMGDGGNVGNTEWNAPRPCSADGVGVARRSATPVDRLGETSQLSTSCNELEALADPHIIHGHRPIATSHLLNGPPLWVAARQAPGSGLVPSSRILPCQQSPDFSSSAPERSRVDSGQAWPKVRTTRLATVVPVAAPAVKRNWHLRKLAQAAPTKAATEPHPPRQSALKLEQMESGAVVDGDSAGCDSPASDVVVSSSSNNESVNGSDSNAPVRVPGSSPVNTSPDMWGSYLEGGADGGSDEEQALRLRAEDSVDRLPSPTDLSEAPHTRFAANLFATKPSFLQFPVKEARGVADAGSDLPLPPLTLRWAVGGGLSDEDSVEKLVDDEKETASAPCESAALTAISPLLETESPQLQRVRSVTSATPQLLRSTSDQWAPWHIDSQGASDSNGSYRRSMNGSKLQELGGEQLGFLSSFIVPDSTDTLGALTSSLWQSSDGQGCSSMIVSGHSGASTGWDDAKQQRHTSLLWSGGAPSSGDGSGEAGLQWGPRGEENPLVRDPQRRLSRRGGIDLGSKMDAQTLARSKDPAVGDYGSPLVLRNNGESSNDEKQHDVRRAVDGAEMLRRLRQRSADIT